MSLSIIKFNNDQQYNIANVQIRTTRTHTSFHPSTHPSCEEILLTIISPNEDMGFLLKWYIENDTKDADLYINIRKADLTDCDRIFKLANVYCISFEEIYDNDFSRRHLIQLSITAKSMTLIKQDTKQHSINSY